MIKRSKRSRLNELFCIIQEFETVINLHRRTEIYAQGIMNGLELQP